MRRLAYIFVVLLVAGAVSCHRTSVTESRLIAIDSLITEAPDSTLALLAEFDTSSLHGEDCAYHALLTAQAMYKAYIPATSDSIINIAWDYYKDCGIFSGPAARMRRIRAMLYKGTTAEETGHLDSAMYWYKRTELESRPDDHYHRGFALMNMGILYQKVYESRHAIEKYRGAVNCFSQLKDSSCMVYCNQQLALLYFEENSDSALIYSNRLDEFTKSSGNSSFRFSSMICRDKMYFYKEQYENSKNEASAIINEFESMTPYTCWYHLVVSYVKLNKLDSANYYLSLMPAPSSIQDSVFYFEMLQVLNQHQGRWEEALKFEKTSNNLSDLVIINDNELNKIEAQAVFDNTKIRPFYRWAIILCIFVSIASIIFALKRKQKNRYATEQAKWLNARYNEAQTRIENLQNENLQLVNANKDGDERMKLLQSDVEILKLLNANMKSVFDNCIRPLGNIAADYYEHGTNASRFIEQFNSEFKACWQENEFWSLIERHINQTRNNAIERITSSHPNITTSELRLIMLTILDFDTTAITICLGYHNSSVLYSMKNKLKRTWNIRENALDGYLKSFTEKDC